MYCHLWHVRPYDIFFDIPHKLHDFWKRVTEHKIGHLKIKKYKLERVENFKYLGVILNEDNNNQIDLQERIKNDNKTHFLKIKTYKKRQR